MKNILQNIRETEFLFHKTDETRRLEKSLEENEDHLRHANKYSKRAIALAFFFAFATFTSLYIISRRNSYISELEKNNQFLKVEHKSNAINPQSNEELTAALAKIDELDWDNDDLRTSLNSSRRANAEHPWKINNLRSEYNKSTKELNDRINECSQENLSLKSQLEAKRKDEDDLKQEESNLESLLSKKDEKIRQLEKQLVQSLSGTLKLDEIKPYLFSDISHLPYFSELVTENQKEAERMFQQILKNEPKNIQNGNFAPLISQYEHALEKDHLNPRANFHLAKCTWLRDKPWFWDDKTWRIEEIDKYLSNAFLYNGIDEEIKRKTLAFRGYLDYIKYSQMYESQFLSILDLPQDADSTIKAKAILFKSSEFEVDAYNILRKALQYNPNNKEAKDLLERRKNRNPYYKSGTMSIFSQRDTFPDYCR